MLDEGSPEEMVTTPPQDDDFPRYPVLGLPMAALTRERLARYVSESLDSAGTTIVFAVHIVGLNLLGEDREYEESLHHADLLHADGMSVVLTARAAGARLPERITTQDYLYDVLPHCAEHGHPVFLLGGPEGLAEAAGRAIAERFPGLSVAGTRDGFFSEEEAAGVAAEVRASGAHLLLVGMGVPREQIWSARYGIQTGVRSLVTCGGTFGYMVGEERRAPTFIRRAGFEWVARLVQDPRRLSRRYIGGIPKLVSQMRRARRESRAATPGRPR